MQEAGRCIWYWVHPVLTSEENVNNNRFDNITQTWEKRFLTDLYYKKDERCSYRPGTASRKKHVDGGASARTPWTNKYLKAFLKKN